MELRDSDRGPDIADSRAPAAGGSSEGVPDVAQPVTRLAPTHATFNQFNRYVGVPALRLGLGRYLSTPFAGYLMLLRTTGRRSGEIREAPLGYVIVGDAVYCMAGFGRATHWFRNILVEPRVEVVLPDRSLTGRAEEVTDPREVRRVLRPLVESMGLVAWAFTGVNPWRASDTELWRAFGSYPIVRIRATGIAAGPNDPGGIGWVVPAVASLVAARWLAGRVAARTRKGRRRG